MQLLWLSMTPQMIWILNGYLCFRTVFTAVNKNSLLAEEHEIDLSLLKDETFLTLSKGFATRNDSDTVFEKAGIDPKVFTG